MIDRQEIMDFAREFGLAPNVVEKDYVLGWFLAGIASHAELGPSWVFKGGPCIKKCFFETYRFSEDLDFTLTAAAHLNQDFLKQSFAGVTQWVYDNTGIEIPENTTTLGTLCSECHYFFAHIQRRGAEERLKSD